MDARLVVGYFFATLKVKHEKEESFLIPVMDDIKLTVDFILAHKQYFGINKTALSGNSYDQSLKERISYIKKIVSQHK